MLDAAVDRPTSGRRVHQRNIVRCVPAAVLAMLAAGCPEVDHGDRMPLSGTVTIQGQPPDIGATIYFDPTAGQGVGSSAEVLPDGKFEVSAENGPTPGQAYSVTLITSPGIPAQGTPPDQIKVQQTYKTSVDVPPRGEDAVELTIDFEAPIGRRR